MSGCNATLHNFECNDHAEGAGRPHVNRRYCAVVTWDDSASGAKPHTPPRFRVAQTTDAWVVVQGKQTVATFPREHFPGNAFHAAKDQAARLNGEDDSGAFDDLHVKAIELRLERDAFRAALEAIANHPWTDNAGAVVMQKRACEALEGVRPDVRGHLRDALWGTP